MENMKESSIKETIIEYLKVIIITVILTYGVLYFIQISMVSGHSMDPSYHNGEVLLVNKKFYSLNDVKYGDVIVATADFGDGKDQIIKRVIGKPGDVIACKDHQMYRNGKKIKETYILEEMIDENWTRTVGKGQIFVMGDNRNNSTDSRVIGPVNFKTAVVGKVIFSMF